MTFREIIFETLEGIGYSRSHITDCFDRRSANPIDVAESNMEVPESERENIRRGFLALLRTGKCDPSFDEAVERCKAHSQKVN